MDEIESSDNQAKRAAAQGKLTKELILQEYKDCFDKVGRFPGEKYLSNTADRQSSACHPCSKNSTSSHSFFIQG